MSKKQANQPADDDNTTGTTTAKDDNPDAAAEAVETPAPAEEVVDWKDRFLRSKADFANLQRRAREEQSMAVRFANADFARALIDVLDDFERTLQAADTAERVADVVTGVRMVHEKMLKALQDHHVEPIVADGEAFDPQLHEALMQQDNAEVPNGTVLQDVRRGYRLHDRILRPSGVIVSRREEPDAADAADGEED